MQFRKFVSKHAQPVTRDVGEYIFQQGDEDRSLYFLRSGFLKAYYLSSDGKKNIKSFVSSGDIIGSLKGIFGSSGCSFSLVCMAPSELLSINFDQVQEAAESDLKLALDVNKFLIDFAIKKESREYELLCLSAEDRYRRLIANTPDLLGSVTQNDIAQYLGVTPVGLSRIKSRITKSDAPTAVTG